MFSVNFNIRFSNVVLKHLWYWLIKCRQGSGDCCRLSLRLHLKNNYILVRKVNLYNYIRSMWNEYDLDIRFETCLSFDKDSIINCDYKKDSKFCALCKELPSHTSHIFIHFFCINFFFKIYWISRYMTIIKFLLFNSFFYLPIRQFVF